MKNEGFLEMGNDWKYKYNVSEYETNYVDFLENGCTYLLISLRNSKLRLKFVLKCK